MRGWKRSAHSKGESLSEGGKTLRLGTAGLRPQAHAQGGVGPLLWNGSAPAAQTVSKCENFDPFLGLKFYSLILKIHLISL